MSSQPSAGARERLLDAVYRSPAAEFATARDDRPVVFPLTPFWDRDREAVVVTSPPAFAGKVERARANPRVSLLFYHDEPLRVHGRATVRDDDPWANARYVRDLIDDQRDTPKKRAFQSANESMRSRLGRLLFDWYALRIVIEIDPAAVERLTGRTSPATPPGWPAADMSSAEARRYDRAVLAVVDDRGRPAPAPVTRFGRDGEAAVLDADLPAGVDDGQPACLLCHRHSPDLADLCQRLVRGRCHPDDDRLRFEVGSSFALRNETALDAARFVLGGKRRTRAYFDDGPLTWRW